MTLLRAQEQACSMLGVSPVESDAAVTAAFVAQFAQAGGAAAQHTLLGYLKSIADVRRSAELLRVHAEYAARAPPRQHGSTPPQPASPQATSPRQPAPAEPLAVRPRRPESESPPPLEPYVPTPPQAQSPQALSPQAQSPRQPSPREADSDGAGAASAPPRDLRLAVRLFVQGADPAHRVRRSPAEPVGLTNERTVCFFNSLVQVYHALPAVRSLIVRALPRPGQPGAHACASRGMLCPPGFAHAAQLCTSCSCCLH
jgi:hypothetical protein